ncbi:MAG: hypothetical protein ACREMA_04935 [Longimicrobiales bacterium]
MWMRKKAELDELSVRAHEARANRMLYAVDPELARSLGYDAPVVRPRTALERSVLRRRAQQLAAPLSVQRQNYQFISVPFGRGLIP